MAGGVYRYETKAGPRWRIVYDGPPTLDPATGNVERKQKQRRGFEREKDARRALRDLQGTIDDGSYVDADDITLARYLTDEWLPSIKPRRASPDDEEGVGSHRGDRGALPRHERPCEPRSSTPPSRCARAAGMTRSLSRRRPTSA